MFDRLDTHNEYIFGWTDVTEEAGADSSDCVHRGLSLSDCHQEGIIKYQFEDVTNAALDFERREHPNLSLIHI